MSYQILNNHQYSDDCDCSICEQQAEYEEYEYEVPASACQYQCSCCEEVDVPENYIAAPTEILGGSSYICGGRRVRRVKRRKTKGRGLVATTKRKAYRRKRKTTKPVKRTTKHHSKK